MKLRSNPNELAITEKPFGLWLIAIFFAAIGLTFVYGALGGFTNSAQISEWVKILTVIIGASGVLGAAQLLHQSPITHLKIDRLQHTVSLSRKGFFVNEHKSFTFAEVKRFSLIRSIDSENEEVWTFSLELENETVLPISALAVASDMAQLDFVFHANQFINKSLPTVESLQTA